MENFLKIWYGVFPIDHIEPTCCNCLEKEIQKELDDELICDPCILVEEGA